MSVQVPSEVFFITVVGGIGSTTFEGRGRCTGIGVMPPGSGQFDLEMLDSDGFGLTGEINLVGSHHMDCDQQLSWKITMQISNAADDGIYKLKIWYS